MTVNSQQNKISYIGNGAATEFAVPFSFLDKSHLVVRQLLNGVQSERTDWTVSGGTMTFDAPPANNAQIVIMRQVPLTQETDYRENEILSAETLERCFDKLTMQVQQLEEKAGRAVTADIFDATDAASLIPSIRQAASDCTAAANAAKSDADTAKEKAAEAQTVLASKADKDVFASKSTRGLAQWASNKNDVSEQKPIVIVSQSTKNMTVIKTWSDGLKEIWVYLSHAQAEAFTYNFPVAFEGNPFVMLSQSIGSNGAAASVLSLSKTAVTICNRSGSTYQPYNGWAYFNGY